jgi:hypothetical protein
MFIGGLLPKLSLVSNEVRIPKVKMTNALPGDFDVCSEILKPDA